MSNDRVYYVYVYLDPLISGTYVYVEFKFNNEPFYIGKGKKDRDKDHVKFANGLKKIKGSHNTHKLNRIRKILKAGAEPIVVRLFDGLNEVDAINKEIELILTIGRRDLGTGTLTNLTSGGDGLANASKEVRDKISKSLIGQIPWNKGKVGIYTDEVRQKISKTLTGRKSIPLTDYQKSCISKAHKNKVVSEETRRKLSESHKGQSAWNKGVKGAQVAWNKGVSIPRNKYKLLYEGSILEIDDMKKYSKENGLEYTSLLALHNGTGFYGAKNYYKGYKRISS